MKDIQRIRHNGNLIQVSITRNGKAKNTRYRVLQSGAQVAERGKDEPESETEGDVRTLGVVNKYTAGRYGHLVKH